MENLFHFFYDGFESLRIVHGEVGEHLAVDLDTCLVESTHELGIAHALETGSSIDTLNPQGAEVAFLVATVTICIGETLLPRVLGYGPNVLASAEVTSGKFQNTLSF